MTVYLLHFDKRYKHAQHYIGYTDNLVWRLHLHFTGRGARLLEVVHDAGIGWTLARTWEGDRQLERRLKDRHGAARFCPICNSKGDPL